MPNAVVPISPADLVQEGSLTMAISVLIADQELTFADALASCLDDEDDLEAVGAVQVKSLSLGPIRGASVQVAVLDGDLRGGAANRLCEELSSGDEPTRVVMLSFSSEPERIVQAIRAGAAAWMRKDESLAQLLDVIRAVARGETWLPPAVTASVVRLLLEEQDRHRQAEWLVATLTPRERAVLACLAEGAGRRDEVAEQLNLSVNTVRTHLQNLMAKLGVHSALEAVALTRDHLGWLPGDSGPSPS